MTGLLPPYSSHSLRSSSALLSFLRAPSIPCSSLLITLIHLIRPSLLSSSPTHTDPQAYLYKWYTAHILSVLKEEQHLALEALHDLGALLSRAPCSTLLHVAAFAGRAKVVEALFQHGASLELLGSSGQNAHALSTSAAVTTTLEVEAERRRVDAAGGQAQCIRVDAEVMARDSSGEYQLGIVTSMASDNTTCTVRFLSSEGEPRVCGLAHVLTTNQWQRYVNRSNHLLRQSLNIKGLLAQVPRHGASRAERRRQLHSLIDEQGYLVPMMSVVSFRTLATRLESGGSIPHSSEMVTVPVTAIPPASKVVFFSHTRLQDSKPDNQHNVKLRGIVEAMQVRSNGVWACFKTFSIDRLFTPTQPPNANTSRHDRHRRRRHYHRHRHRRRYHQ